MKKAILYLSIITIVYLLTFLTTAPDKDLWARLAVGSIFFQTGSVLKTDIFSYIPTKDLWIDHEWGSGVVFYFFAKLFGEGGMFALKAFVLLMIIVIILKIIKYQSGKEPGIMYVLFLALSIDWAFPLLRCQMFTYLFFTLWIYTLERMKRDDHTLIWIFPVTMLLWVNMHGGFLAGMGVLLIYAVGETLNRDHYLKYWGVLAFMIPVTLMNPYGLDLWRYVIEASFMPRPFIQEWQPVNFIGPNAFIGGFKVHILSGFAVFALLTFMVGIKLMMKKTKTDWTRILLITILFYLSVVHQRHSVFFVLAVSGLFYHHYINLFGFMRKYIEGAFTRPALKILEIVKYSYGYLLLAVLFIYLLPRLNHHVIVNPYMYPVGSLEFIKQNNISGNLAVSFNWGSYAFWKLYPQCKVLIDGRYEEVYSDPSFTKAVQFSVRTGDWQAILREYPADILILSNDYYSPSDFSYLTNWQPVYHDYVSYVLLPKERIKTLYIHPDYQNPKYFKEDFAKHIKINPC